VASADETARLVAGLQPVREAIRVHGPALGRVAVDARPLPRLDALARFATDRGCERVDRLARGELDRLSGGASHQGVLAWAPALRLVAAAELFAEADLVAVALDEIQDPQNFGALIRSAVGIASAPIIWGEHASAPLSTATFRASAGAIEHARLCRVPSLRQSLQEAGTSGIQVIGLDPRSPARLHDLDLTGPTVLVIGSEHTGLKRGVRRACTALAHLIPPAQVDSLNASVAAGIALYEVAIQRASSRG
jgi:23S rRNA (guanosine2251-2'-O)-methyltransferase